MASPVDYGKKAFDNFLLLCVQDNPDSPVAQEFKTELDQNISKGGLKAFQELNELLNKTKPETLEKFKNKSFQSAMLLMKSEMDKLGGKESLLPVFNPETEKELFLAEWNGKVQQVFKSISSKPGVNPASAAPSFLHEKEVKESADSVTAREAMSSLIGILGGIVDGLEGQRSNELRKRPKVDEEEITPRYTTVINEIKKAFDKAQHCLSKVPITKNEIKTELYVFRMALTHILGNAFSVAELRTLKMPLLRGDRWLELKKGFIGERGPKEFKSPEALFNYFDNLQKRIIFVKQLEQFTYKNDYGSIKNSHIRMITAVLKIL